MKSGKRDLKNANWKHGGVIVTYTGAGAKLSPRKCNRNSLNVQQWTRKINATKNEYLRIQFSPVEN
jgi:hypothetical protein